MAYLNQIAELQIKDLIIKYPDLHLEFSFEEKDDNSPQKLQINIFNLSDETANAIDEGQGIRFNIGYGSNLGLIFQGFVNDVRLVKRGAEKITQISAVSSIDSGKGINVNYSRNVMIRYVIKDICKRLGYKIKNLEVFRNLKFDTGYSEDNINLNSIKRLVEKSESWMSIQGEDIYIYDPRTIRKTNVYFLNFRSGLLKNPNKVTEKDKRYNYIIESLPINTVKKGSIIQVESETFNGLVQVIEIKIQNWRAVYKVGEVK